MENSRFPESLKNRRDFVELLKKGKRVHNGPWLTLNFRNNDHSSLRLGLTVPRFVGNAVIRNRLKRWSKEFVRNQKKELGHKNLDANISLRKMGKEFYKNLKHEDFDKHLRSAFEKIV